MTVLRPLTLIAAVARNGVIGRDGAMPWHLPGDLAHFRRGTMGRPVLVGRKTYEAIGGALPGRDMVAVSADPAFAPPDVKVGRTIKEALLLADTAAARLGAPAIMVAGGGSIYRALIDVADALWITVVDASPDGDTLFPPIDPRRWALGDRQYLPRQPDDSAHCILERWSRRDQGGVATDAGSWARDAPEPHHNRG